MSKHVAIVGTAETWSEAPWKDESVRIHTLNDAYMLRMPRIDEHYEMHPLNRFFFRKPGDNVTLADVPFGFYVRPEGHLEWLQQFAQTKRLWLQEPPPKGWTEARNFPREEIREQFKRVLFIDPTWEREYVASGPVWMILNAIKNGAEKLTCVGIHLSTSREYVDQRPNFECIIGYALGLGIEVHLPKRTPICKAQHVYCYEPRMTVELDRLSGEVGKLQKRQSTLVQGILNGLPPLIAGRRRRELERVNIELAEAQHALRAVDFRTQVTRPEWRT